MSNFGFNRKQLRFLELYFSGYTMQNAVRLAGYRWSTPQSRCNTGAKILKKFSTNPQALFRLAGVRAIAGRLYNLAFNSRSAFQRLKALKILARSYFL